MYIRNISNNFNIIIIKFENIEEIEETRSKIQYNLSKIRFQTKNTKFNKKIICVDLNEKENRTGKIKLPELITITNSEQLICRQKTTNTKKKLLVKIEMRLYKSK